MKFNDWRGLNDLPIQGGSHFGLMGILNITPDSFFDGGKFNQIEYALQKAEQLVNEGSHIIDIGPESSRPGSQPVGDVEELSRLKPVLRSVAQTFPGTVISVDTWHPATAQFALENGAAIINDVSACLWEPALLEVVASFKPGYVLMHNNGIPEKMQIAPHYDNVISDLLHFFEKNLAKLINAGLPESHIILDPGIGFGKRPQDNMAILSHLPEFLVFSRPLLLGISMKSFFKDFFSIPLGQRETITAVTTVLAWQKGVFWHRLHNPGMAAKSLELAVQMGFSN